MTASRPTDDCLALLEVLLWNHFLPAATNETQQNLPQTSAAHEKITCSYLDWLSMRGYLSAQQLSTDGLQNLECHTIDRSVHHQPALTEAGARFAVEAMRQQGRWDQMATLLAISTPSASRTDYDSGQLTGPAASVQVVPRLSHQPHWDSHHRELWLGRGLVKKIRTSAINQERILSAFEEEHWPECVYDPLPPVGDVDPKQRLLDAVRRLNGHQLARHIHFLIVHRGERVAWRPQETD